MATRKMIGVATFEGDPMPRSYLNFEVEFDDTPEGRRAILCDEETEHYLISEGDNRHRADQVEAFLDGKTDSVYVDDFTGDLSDPNGMELSVVDLPGKE